MTSCRAMSRVPVSRLVMLSVLLCLKCTCNDGVNLRSEAIDSDFWEKRTLINSELNNVWYFGRTFISDVQNEDANSGVVESAQSEDTGSGVLTEQSAGVTSEVRTDSVISSGVVVGSESEDLTSRDASKSTGSGAFSSGVSGQISGDVSGGVLGQQSGDLHGGVSGPQSRDINDGVSGPQSTDSIGSIFGHTEGNVTASVKSEDTVVVGSENQSGVLTNEDLRNASASVKSDNITSSGDSGQTLDPPLILTGLLEEGKLTEARERCRVSGGPFPTHIPSYSGFFTVDKKYNSNLFFWFFPSENNYNEAPVILWLQGGPGDSSLMGLFNELGPFSVAPDVATLVANNNSWHKNHSILFIDNPVGTGFSFTEHDEGYASNQTQIGSSLYEALIQFFTLFHELQNRDFYIAGSSYAGKYVPALGHFIHTRNPETQLKINLKGVAVCSGYTDPINMMGLNEFAFQLGFIDSRTRDEMKVLEEETKQAALNGDMMGAIVKKIETAHLFYRYTTFVYGYNLMHPKEPYEEYRFSWFLRKPEVRALIHVGDVEFTTDEQQNMTKVFEYLMEDNMVSARPWLEELLENHYRVLYYNGQLDITITYPMSARMYDHLTWSGAEEYRGGDRIPWYVNGVLAGYMKSGGNFTDVVVRNAGHLVSLEQPEWALDLITRFIANTLPTSDVEC